MTEELLDDLVDGAVDMADALAALWEECKGDEREFGRMVARAAGLPLSGPNGSALAPSGV